MSCKLAIQLVIEAFEFFFFSFFFEIEILIDSPRFFRESCRLLLGIDFPLANSPENEKRNVNEMKDRFSKF